MVCTHKILRGVRLNCLNFAVHLGKLIKNELGLAVAHLPRAYFERPFFMQLAKETYEVTNSNRIIRQRNIQQNDFARCQIQS